MGQDYLRSRAIESTGIGLTSSPTETAALYHQKPALIERFHRRVQADRFDHLIIYCNSLSFAGSWEELYRGKVWDLKAAYESIFNQLNQSPTVALTAEEHLKNQLEQLALRQNPTANLTVQARLNWVQKLEQLPAEQRVSATKKYLTDFARQGFQKVLLACTHFEHEAFEDFNELEVIQPGLKMLKRFVDGWQDF